MSEEDPLASLAANYAQRGRGYAQQSQWEEAANWLERAVQYDSTRPGYYMMLAMSYEELHRFADAVDAAERALQPHATKEQLAGSFNVIGRACYQLKDMDKSAQAWRAFTELEPNLLEGWRGLALACWELDRFEETIEACNQALRIAPDRQNLIKIRELSQQLLGYSKG